MGIRVIPRRTATATPLVAAATTLVSALFPPVPVFAAGASTARTPAPGRPPRERRTTAGADLDLDLGLDPGRDLGLDPGRDLKAVTSAQEEQVPQPQPQPESQPQPEPVPEPVRLGKSRLTCAFASVRQEDPVESRTTLFGQAVLCQVQEWHHRLTAWERAGLHTLTGDSDHGPARRLWTDLSHSYLARILTRVGPATEAGRPGGCPA